MKTLKLALILVPFKERVFDTISIPLGLAWLNSFLKKEFNEKIHIDNFDFLLEPDTEDAFFDKVKNNFYDFIGIQAHSDVTVNETIRIAKTCKSFAPDTPIIMGGNAATFLPDLFFSNNCVDFIVLSEGEVAFSLLIKKLISDEKKFSDIPGIIYKEGESLQKTANGIFINNLDEIPLPNREAFNWKKYPQWSVITSRGCPYSCIYCSSTAFWKNKIRFRSAKNVFEELIQLKEKFGAEKFYFLDDTFGANKNITSELLNLIIDSKYNFNWACLTRGDVVDKPLLELFKKAGCIEIHYGLESSSKKTQSLIGKSLSIKKLTDAIKWTKELEIPVKLSAIIGLPGETKKDVINTIEFAFSQQPDEIQFYPLTTYIGTDVNNSLEKYNVKILQQDISKWIKNAENPQMETNLLSKDDIIDLCKLAVSKFKEVGYSWIPHDIPPQKVGKKKVIKTVFAPIQNLEKSNYE